MNHVRASGFPFPENLIHLFIGGSELHGAKVGSTDDLDIYGVYIEPPHLRLGIDSFPHFVWSTAGNERRNGPDDVDITLYSLGKLALLMAKGNPTALHFLMAPNLSGRDDPWDTRIRPQRALFAAAPPLTSSADSPTRSCDVSKAKELGNTDNVRSTSVSMAAIQKLQCTSSACSMKELNSCGPE